MKNLILYIAFAILASYMHNLNAQSNEDIKPNKKESKIQFLEKKKESIVSEEKKALKKAVLLIEDKLEAKKITAEKAQELKEKAAVKHALNIENKIAIIDYQIALIERNGLEKEAFKSSFIELGLGSKYKGRDRLFGIRYSKGNLPVKYDKRTTSDFVFAVGFNNTIQDGVSLDDSDFRFAGSRFLEVGWAWKTRVFKNTNFLRIKYGLSFQINNLKPTDNRIFVDEGEQTTLQEFDFELDKSKLRFTNLVIPVHFEFGPSRKTETEDYVRYSTRKKIKIGLGGYGGIRIGSRQKLRFKDQGDRIRQKIRGDFNLSDFVYGVSSYIGWGSAGIYAKYDLSTLFNDDQPDQHNISLGLRFDLD